MAGNGKGQGAFAAARPETGDLVDRFLENKLRAALFGGQSEVTLGRLHIEGTLGQGAMGAVLSAFDPVLDRHVAIKSLRPGQGQDSQRLLREARMLAKLDHANIVSIFDVLEEEGGLYLVMEQIRGGDLRAWMEEEHPWQEVVELFAAIGRGLAAAHALGIAHCDVKPENVVVSEGRPRLIDFGLAHQQSDGPSHGGTRAYLAPERLAGQEGSAGADQYAFFVTLVEAIEGQRPSVDEEPRWETMPRWLGEVARRGLQEDPRRRFPDMNTAVAALRPTRAPSRLWIAPAVVVLAGAGFAVAMLALPDRESHKQLCQGAAAQLEELWTPAARDGMKRAFGASGAANALETWQEVDTSLDRYATQWRELRTQSCVATRVHRDQSVELMDFSMACFDRRLLSVRSVVQLFADDPNEVVIASARSIVGELPELASCTDPASLEQAVPLPEGEAQRSTLLALEERFEAIKNQDRRGHFTEALALADELIAPARALDYAPLTARLLVLQAALQVTLGELETAETTLREAASAAAKARDDKGVAEVWTRVLDLLAQQSRFDEALTLEAVAITSAERIPEHYETQARLQNALGGIYLAKARYQDAYKAYQQALAMQRNIGSDGNPALAPAIANFALAKWYTGDLNGAAADLQEALDMMLPELGPDHSRVAYIRQNIADLHMQLGEQDQAHAHYLEVLRIWKQSLGEDHANLAYPYEQLAVLARDRGDFEEARAKIAEALRLRERSLGPDHALVLQALSVLATIYIAEGGEESLQKAEETIRRAVAIQDALGEAGQRHAVYILESRAQIAELREDWKAALRDRMTVLDLRVDTLGATHRDTAYSFAQVGRMQMKLGRLPVAADYYAKAQAIFDAEPELREEDGIAMRQGRAEILSMQGKHEEALALFQDALTRAERAGLDRAYEVRFGLAQARLAAGHNEAALHGAKALAAELQQGEDRALRDQVEAWIEEH